jgi:hypothetical protein
VLLDQLACRIKTNIGAQVFGSFGVGSTWMALFDSLLNQFVGSFARAYELSVFKFDACEKYVHKVLIYYPCKNQDSIMI